MRGGRRRQLTGRELWRIGDWGGASLQIGRRWERVGASHLAALPGRPDLGPEFEARAALSFVSHDGLSASIQAAGLPNADAVLLGTVGPRLALRRNWRASCVQQSPPKWTSPGSAPFIVSVAFGRLGSAMMGKGATEMRLM